jgi:hypothetical protein
MTHRQSWFLVLRAIVHFLVGFLFALWLAGCELCQEHPVGCGVVGGIVVACVVESFDKHHNATQAPNSLCVTDHTCSHIN